MRMFDRMQQDMIEEDLGVMAHVVQAAIAAERLPPDTLELLDIQAVAPTLAVRDRLQDAQADQILVRNQAMSVETMAARHGLSPDHEQQLISRRADVREANFNPNEPRDERGRWARAGSTGPLPAGDSPYHDYPDDDDDDDDASDSDGPEDGDPEAMPSDVWVAVPADSGEPDATTPGRPNSPTDAEAKQRAKQDAALDRAFVEATNAVINEIKAGKVVPRTTRFIRYPDGRIDVVKTDIDETVLKQILANNPGAELFAQTVAAPSVAVAISPDEFYHGTDEEILTAIMARAKQALRDQMTPMQKLGEATEALQNMLDAVSLVPGIAGDVATGVSGTIDLVRGHWTGAGLSLTGLIPVLGGAAVISKLEKAAAKMAEVERLAKLSKVDAMAEKMLKAARKGQKLDTFVYRALGNAKKVIYVGITNDIARREAEHLAQQGFRIKPLLKRLSRSDARAVEQVLIEIHGLGKNEGTLLNKINSIAKTNPIFGAQLRRGLELLKSIGYNP